MPEAGMAQAAFQRLLDIMDELRVKCPWDRVQTNETLRPLTLEETYELSDAVLSDDADALRGELGDLSLHIVFYAKIAEEQGRWDIVDVLNGVCEKLVRRHPHVFGDAAVQDESDVRRNWEELKLQEGTKSVLKGVPDGLPPLLKAHRMQEKVANYGFDWAHADDVWAKVLEELDELRVEVAAGDADKMEAEFGDVLFALINYARFIGVNPDTALERTNRKFKTRFQYIEERALANGRSLRDMTLAEMDVYWDEAKRLQL